MSRELEDFSQTSVRPKEPTQTRNKRKKKKRYNSKKLTLDIPRNVRSLESGPDTTKVVKTVRGFGYTEEEINKAVHKLKEAREAVTFDSLIDVAFSVQKESLEQEVLDGSGRRKEQPHLSEEEQPRDVCDGEAEDEVTDEEEGDKCKRKGNTEEDFKLKLRRAVEKKKMELRDAIDSLTFTCKMCNYSKATILLLPCGHLASCDDCLTDVRRCPIARCNKVVRGTKEVYLV